MKKKHLEVIQQINKKVVIFKPLECLNYIKPSRNAFLEDPFHSEAPLQESRGIDNDFRERYRI
jgi:hypothetical protein